MESNQVPLKILVCDKDQHQIGILFHAFRGHQAVITITEIDSLRRAQQELRTGDWNTIFIDPLKFDLDEASDCIFHVRKSRPEIVFVLHIDFALMEAKRAEFFKGERARFIHYFKLDKRIDPARFQGEVRAALAKCQVELQWAVSETDLERLRDELVASKKRETKIYGPDNDVSNVYVINKLNDTIEKMSSRRRPIEPRTVFVSYRFEETEYFDGIAKLLIPSPKLIESSISVPGCRRLSGAA